MKERMKEEGRKEKEMNETREKGGRMGGMEMAMGKVRSEGREKEKKEGRNERWMVRKEKKTREEKMEGRGR